MLAVICFWRMTLTDSGHGQQLHQPDGQGHLYCWGKPFSEKSGRTEKDAIIILYIVVHPFRSGGAIRLPSSCRFCCGTASECHALRLKRTWFGENKKQFGYKDARVSAIKILSCGPWCAYRLNMTCVGQDEIGFKTCPRQRNQWLCMTHCLSTSKGVKDFKVQTKNQPSRESLMKG